MATLKAIRRRISSVKSTQQITRAMKLVAAARLRRAQEALLNARPYHEALVRVADSLFATERAALGPAEDAKREALIVVIASDRGLCGGYNANLHAHGGGEARRAERDRDEGQVFRRRAQGARPFHAAPGTRSRISGINNPRLATVGLARDLAARMLADYRARRRQRGRADLQRVPLGALAAADLRAAAAGERAEARARARARSPRRPTT